MIKKTTLCYSCGVPIVYAPNMGRDTLVKCYACPAVNTYPYEEEDPGFY